MRTKRVQCLQREGRLVGGQGARSATRGNVARSLAAGRETGSSMFTNAVSCMWFRAGDHSIGCRTGTCRPQPRSALRRAQDGSRASSKSKPGLALADRTSRASCPAAIYRATNWLRNGRSVSHPVCRVKAIGSLALAHQQPGAIALEGGPPGPRGQ